VDELEMRIAEAIDGSKNNKNQVVNDDQFFLDGRAMGVLYQIGECKKMTKLPPND
jgi:hypothetical protein